MLAINKFICYNKNVHLMSRSGGIGRRTGFKIQRWQHHKGSSPFSGTKVLIDPVWVYFFVFFYLRFAVDVNDSFLLFVEMSSDVFAEDLPSCL